MDTSYFYTYEWSTSKENTDNCKEGVRNITCFGSCLFALWLLEFLLASMTKTCSFILQLRFTKHTGSETEGINENQIKYCQTGAKVMF